MDMRHNLFLFIFCILSLSALLFAFITITQAAPNLEAPNYTIIIDKNGNISSSGNLFSDDLWYPGKEESGIIRIISANPANITKLGFDVRITDHKPEYDADTIYQSFTNQMKLSLKRGRLLVFSQTLFENRSFSSIMHGLNLDREANLHKNRNSIDLKYTLVMSDEAGEELEQVTANVKFIVELGQ